MPPTNEPINQKTLEEVVELTGDYPLDAYHFVQQGLGYTVEKMHGGLTDPSASRHVSGQQLCEGLREYALLKWGLLARTVLRRWQINATIDFGKIVFAMVENGLMQTTENDRLDDFRDVYDFRAAFESGYRISSEIREKTTERRT